jgi:hypothetical protein
MKTWDFTRNNYRFPYSIWHDRLPLSLRRSRNLLGGQALEVVEIVPFPTNLQIYSFETMV